ncbi:MAG TPA: signal peptidase I [Terriglobia bacterium]|nr:signal peptidase I [Terriglobia bacterium]
MGTGEENAAQGGPTHPVSRRVPWRAALLSVAVAGLGELYSGRPLRALAVNVAALVAGLVYFKSLFIPLQPWNILAPSLIILSAGAYVLGDSVYCARKAPRDYRLRAYNRWYVYVLLIVLFGAGQDSLKSIIHSEFMEGRKVTSESMFPTMLKGDYFLVDKRAYTGRTPQVGDIIAFRLPTNPSVVYAKRIVATGGEILKVKDEKAFTDGKPLDEPFVQPPTQPMPLRDDFPPYPDFPAARLVSAAFDPKWVQQMPQFIRSDGIHVPPGDFFVMGDNRLHSYDSRHWGFVPQADILGKVSSIYFSWDAVNRHVRWSRIGEVLR